MNLRPKTAQFVVVAVIVFIAVVAVLVVLVLFFPYGLCSTTTLTIVVP